MSVLFIQCSKSYAVIYTWDGFDCLCIEYDDNDILLLTFFKLDWLKNTIYKSSCLNSQIQNSWMNKDILKWHRSSLVQLLPKNTWHRKLNWLHDNKNVSMLWATLIYQKNSSKKDLWKQFMYVTVCRLHLQSYSCSDFYPHFCRIVHNQHQMAFYSNKKKNVRR